MSNASNRELCAAVRRLVAVITEPGLPLNTKLIHAVIDAIVAVDLAEKRESSWIEAVDEANLASA